MKKFLLLTALILLAVTIGNGSNITGLLIQATSMVLAIARSVIKEILTLVIKVL